MLAIRICKENLPIITELNGGIEPELDEDMLIYSTFFVFELGIYNAIMPKALMRRRFAIRQKLDSPIESYILDEK